MISILNDFIVNLFATNNLVNTQSIVSVIEIDNNKENLYPLVNIDLKNSNVQEQIVIVDFEISILQQRNTSNKQTDNKLLKDSNYIDNMNETHFIGQKFINHLRNTNNDYNIELDAVTDLIPLKNRFKNSLDGYQFTISLSYPNNVPKC